MKKTLSVILALIMTLSCAVTMLTYVAADEAAPVAPIIRGAQNTEPSGNTQSIRFLSTVNELVGDKLGYVITAQFTHNGEYKTVTYSGEEYESNWVFESVRATSPSGTYQTVNAQEEYGQKYFFPMTINGVPTNIGDIFFTIEVYVVSGDQTITSAPTYMQWVDGEYTEKTGNGYFSYQNFDNCEDVDVSGVLSTDTDKKLANAISSVGWKLDELLRWTNGNDNIKNNFAVKDGEVTLDLGGSVVEVVSKEALVDMTEYTVEMDMSIEKLGSLKFLFNNANGSDNADVLDADYLNIGLRNAVYSGTTLSQGAVETETTAGTFTHQLLYKYTALTSLTDSKLPYGDADGAKTYHIEISVNNLNRTVSFMVDGEYLLKNTYVEDKYAIMGGFYIQSQNGKATIDNVRVYAKNASNANATAGTVLFAQTFDDYSADSTTSTALDTLGWSALNVHTWHVNKLNYAASIVSDTTGTQGMYATFEGGCSSVRVISDDVFAGVDKYTIQLQMKLSPVYKGESTDPLVGAVQFILSHEYDTKTIKSGNAYSATGSDIDGVLFRNAINVTETNPTGSSATADGAAPEKIGVGFYKDYESGGAAHSKVLSDANYNEWMTIAIEVDVTAKTINFYMDTDNDGSVADETAVASTTCKDMCIRGFDVQSQNTVVSLDNIMVVAGTRTDLPQ